MSVLFQTINPSIGFIIHILSEGITCYLRLARIFTERCEVMLLSSTDLKVCLARPWSTIFSIAIRLNCFRKACCWVVRQYYIHLGFVFFLVSAEHTEAITSYLFLFCFKNVVFFFSFFLHIAFVQLCHTTLTDPRVSSPVLCFIYFFSFICYLSHPSMS